MIKVLSHSRFLNPVSFVTLVLLYLLIVTARSLTPIWLHHDWLAPISWDVFGYYLYLPATFIHHDTGLHNFAWLQQVLDTYKPTIGFYQAYMGPAGDYVMKYPMGLAILYSPFFFIAHASAHLLGYAPDGFSLPYQVFMAFGPLVYTGIGLWFFRKVLLNFFSDGITTLVMLITVLGTNYLELTAYNGIMPHNTLFMLFALTVWLTIRWHERQKWSTAIFLGLLIGIAMLVRPTSGLIVLVPLFWGVWNFRSLHEKMILIRDHGLQVLALILAMILVGSFQLIYWKIHAGSWIYYSYEKGESLRWIAPYIKLVLFSYKKGWLLYTPVMIFAIIGFIPLFRKYREIFGAAFLFIAMHLIVVASWPTWWYGGSFSQRPMMEAYVVLAFPLGAMIGVLLNSKRRLRAIMFTLILLLVALNLFQSWQYTHYIISPSQMTKGYYWAVFGKTNVTTKETRLLEPSGDPSEREWLPQSDRFTARVLAQFDFEQADPAKPGLYAKDTTGKGSQSMRLNAGNAFSPGITLPYRNISTRNFAWIQVCGSVYFTCKPEEVKCNLVVTCIQNGEAYKYRMIALDKQNLQPGTWNRICMDYMTPYLAHPGEPVQAYFWCYGEQEVLVDDIVIKLFEFGEE
ncbi:MAG: glycosyltransferase family 39 protein [Bacteroidales bacterium]|nr:glycosyltransferase family 39 protein [Bacteroidales bacterium]